MTEVRIYCDHDDHAPRESEIVTLQRVPGGWAEVPGKSYALRMASGNSSQRWVPATPFQIMQDTEGNRWARWDLRCHLDERHNVQLRQEKLFPRLDKVADAGMFELPLRLLGASL